MKSKKFLKQFEEGNLQIFGGFDGLLKTAIMNHMVNNPMDFVSGLCEGLKTGKKEGYNQGLHEGTEHAIKSFITSGDKQIFVTKKNIYPFGNVDDLFTNEDVTSHIREFVLQPELSEFRKKESRLSELETKFNEDIIKEIENLQDSISQTSSKSKNLKSKSVINAESRIEYINKTPKDKFFETEFKRIEEKINNNRQLIKGSNMSTSIDDFAKSNKLILEKYEQNAQTKSPNKNDVKQMNLRNKVNELYGKYSELKEYNELPSQLQDLQDTIKNLSQPNNLKKAFTQKRKGDYSIFMSDNFNIYNVQNIQKLYPKNISDVQAKLQANQRLKLDLDNIVTDYRTKKVRYDDLPDYIQMPSYKLKNKDTFEELLNKRFNGNIPEDISKFALALRNQKI